METIPEADIHLAPRFQMDFSRHTIFSMEWRIEHYFMILLMPRQGSLPSIYWTRRRSMFHALALGSLPSVIRSSS